MGILAAFWCLLVPVGAAGSIGGWELINAQLNDMAYGSSVYVAVGEEGFILRSVDGDSWEKVESGVDGDLHAVVYGNGTFVATGERTTLISPDGLDWTEQDPAVDVFGFHLVYAEGTFVAQGPEYVYLSTDGATWTEHDTGAIYLQQSLAYGNSLFVIGTSGGEILTSANGSSGWTTQESPVSDAIFDITYSGTQFVAVGFNGRVVTSPDGMSWSQESSGISKVINAVGYGNGLYVAAGGISSVDTGYVWTSPDGAEWTEQDSGIFEWMYDAAYIEGKYYVIGGGKIIRSDDGLSWTTVYDATGWEIISMGYGEGVYVGGTFGGTGIRSTDGGSTWSDMVNTEGSPIEGIAWHEDLGLFIGVCQDGRVLTASPADDFWTVTAHAVSTPLWDAAFDPLTGNTVMVGDGRTIAMINASDVLSTTASVTTSALYGVAVSGSTYVAVGWGGAVIVSQDSGANWETVTPATGETLLDVEHGNGMWMAGGYSGTLIMSSNGVDWTDASGLYGSIYGIVYGDGLFVAYGARGSNGTVMVSEDGLDWNEYDFTSGYLASGAYAEGTFTLGGDDGVILRSLPADDSGGGGGGGCSTVETSPRELLWANLIWIVLMGALLYFLRKRAKEVQEGC